MTTLTLVQDHEREELPELVSITVAGETVWYHPTRFEVITHMDKDGNEVVDQKAA